MTTALTPLLTPKEAAAILRTTENVLAQWRSMGRGPRFVKYENGRIHYDLADVADWIEQSKTMSTAPRGPKAHAAA